MHKQPTAEQIAEVRRYAEEKGDGWKDCLLRDWQRSSAQVGGQHSPLLQQVRNQHGPRWLASFE